MFDKVKHVLELRVELLWTQIKFGAASTMSTATVWTTVGLCALLFLLFASLAAAFALGQSINNPALGFLLVGSVYLLFAIIGIATRAQIKARVQTGVDKAIDRLARAGLEDMTMEEVTAAGLPGADTRLEGQFSPAPIRNPERADPANSPRSSATAESHGDRLRGTTNGTYNRQTA